MGYDVHVTRQDFPANGDVTRNIGDEEWLALVESDEEMRLEGQVTAHLPFGQKLVYVSPLLAMWSGHPNNVDVPFDFLDGDIIVKNPDTPILNKMRELASRLNARVQGEEGEFYD